MVLEVWHGVKTGSVAWAQSSGVKPLSHLSWVGSLPVKVSTGHTSYILNENVLRYQDED